MKPHFTRPSRYSLQIQSGCLLAVYFLTKLLIKHKNKHSSSSQIRLKRCFRSKVRLRRKSSVWPQEKWMWPFLNRIARTQVFTTRKWHCLLLIWPLILLRNPNIRERDKAAEIILLYGSKTSAPCFYPIVFVDSTRYHVCYMNPCSSVKN